MEKLEFKLKKPKRIYSKKAYTCDQIWRYFSKQIAFPRLMKLANQVGDKALFELWSEVKQSNADNHLALFLWKCQQEQQKITWNE